MKRFILIVAVALGLLAIPGCGNGATSQPGHTYVLLIVGGNIYLDITDRDIAASEKAKGAIIKSSIPAGSSIACSNPAKTITIWNDGTEQSKTAADYLCTGNGWKK